MKKLKMIVALFAVVCNINLTARELPWYMKNVKVSDTSKVIKTDQASCGNDDCGDCSNGQDVNVFSQPIVISVINQKGQAQQRDCGGDCSCGSDAIDLPAKFID